jgi:hemerythrin
LESFQWDACFETGLPDVDEQHRRLVDHINRFGTLVAAGTIDANIIDAVLDELTTYAALHFRNEDALMSSVGLDTRHVLAHGASHTNFLAEVGRMREDATSGDLTKAEFLLRFLIHWLAYHILGQDQTMARQVAAVRAGAKPDDALALADSENSPATETLLRALSSLFHQVSERNRDLSQLNRTLEVRVAERTHALHEANLQLASLAMTDPLTGLPNRRHAMSRLVREWNASLVEGTPLACMLIDADQFKLVNDTYGHEAGDKVLRELARTLAHAARTDDLVARLGGDEFLVICPRTPLEGALRFGADLTRIVASVAVPLGADTWRGSVSIGIAVRSPEMTGLEDLMRAADEGLYAAKHKVRGARTPHRTSADG